MLPHIWALTYAEGTYPVLSTVMAKILSKHPSASPTERSWSHLEITMGKLRTRLLDTTLGKLLYVRQNLKTVEQFGKDYDRADLMQGVVCEYEYGDDGYMVDIDDSEVLEEVVVAPVRTSGRSRKRSARLDDTSDDDDVVDVVSEDEPGTPGCFDSGSDASYDSEDEE